MNQTLFMIFLELVATLGIFVQGPIAAVAVYYLFAVLRPQHLWQWALPWGVPWSDYPAGAAVLGLVLSVFGLPPIGPRRNEPFTGFAFSHFAFLCFALWVCITYFTALDQETAWPWLLEYLTIFTMFFVSIFVIRT